MEDWNETLHTAAAEGNIKDVKICLQNSADIDYLGSYGSTALMLAAGEGHLEVCRLILDLGCETDITDLSGYSALMYAASKGHLEVCRSILDNGCKTDIPDELGVTAIMLAASRGHLEVCQLLIERGCGTNITDSDGYTALHLAAGDGYLQTTRCLVEKGNSNLLVTTHQGQTPYERAVARNYGQNLEVMEYLQIVMSEKSVSAALRKQGFETDVPIEIKLMADKRSVPLYLNLLESGSEKKRDIRLVIVGKKGAGKTSLVQRLFKEGKKGAVFTSIYKKLFGGNTEDVTSTNGIEIHMRKCKENFGDCIWNKLEGNYEETELHARLLKPYEEKLTSKDSLALIEKAAKMTLTDITTLTVNDESRELRTVSHHNKLESPISTEYKEQSPLNAQIIDPVDPEHKDTQIKYPGDFEYKEKPSEDTRCNSPEATEYKENTPKATKGKEAEGSLEIESHQRVKIKPLEITQLKPPAPQVANSYRKQHQHLPLEKAYNDIQFMMEKSNANLLDKEDYANILLWDFAGDEEFYHTHQTFLSQNAIYLVVAKLNEADDTNAQGMFQLWMNSIHCYCRLDDQQNRPESVTVKMDKNTTTQDTNISDPPVILVGSHKDKIRQSKGEKIEIECNKRIQSYVKDVSDDACGHIRSEYFISNTKDNDGVFKQMKQDILNLARGMQSWNREYPLKFIQLEKYLQEKKMELQIPVITFKELTHISLETPMPMNDEELKLFLKFHHEIRAIVYFADLPDFIILDTQWLSDAFKCIVTPTKFQFNVSRHKMKEKLDDLNLRGILHTEVLKDIFKHKKNILYQHYQHKDDILNIMEKFDIIIPATRDSVDAQPCFYVPCMVKSKPEYDIYKLFNVTYNTCKKSTWLCFQFRFLPPHLINHLIASLSRKFRIAELDTTKQEQSQVALFKGTAVFEILKTTKLRKLLLMTCPNMIQIQILEFKTEIKKGLYKDIAAFVTDEINKIIIRRFKMSNVNFVKMWKCGLHKPESDKGLNEFSEKQIIKFHCEKCKATHRFTDEWSDQQNEPVRITKEEFNCTKMGMIVLNILADVLYDLLKQDKSNLPVRSDCDITYLYSEHRRLNKHVPSNSSHRRCPWGGNWVDIQNTDIAIGDDIERIRLTRNELQHARTFNLNENRFNDLCNIIGHLLKRFDQIIKPVCMYTDRLNETLAKTCSEEEVISI